MTDAAPRPRSWKADFIPRTPIGPAPPRVPVSDAFWTNPPPSPSPRCAWWLSRVEAGWRPNGRIDGFGYDEAADYFGVWIWEWLNVLSPAIRSAQARDRGVVGRVIGAERWLSV